jgi:hypothetical protein
MFIFFVYIYLFQQTSLSRPFKLNNHPLRSRARRCKHPRPEQVTQTPTRPTPHPHHKQRQAEASGEGEREEWREFVATPSQGTALSPHAKHTELPSELPANKTPTYPGNELHTQVRERARSYGGTYSPQKQKQGYSARLGVPTKPRRRLQAHRR